MKEDLGIRTRSAQMHLLLILAVGFSVVYILAGHPFLPPKYSYDEEKIAALAREEPGIPTDKSFQIVADIYRVTGLADLPLLAGIIGFVAFCAILLFAMRARTAARLSLVTVGIVAAVIFLGAVYLGHYAKEFFILPICALVTMRTRRWPWDVVILIFIILYAVFFRSYWFIVGGFYVMFRLLLLKYSPLKSMIIGSIAGLAFLSAVFVFYMGLDLDHYRMVVNDSRVDNVDAQSAIQPLTSMGGFVGGFINALAVLASFVVPIPLVAKGQFFYLLIVVFLMALWVRLFTALQKSWKTSVRGGAEDPWVQRCVALLFAFTVVQSIFEPDYGSYIRHLSPLLPLMLSIVLQPSDQPKVAEEAPVDPMLNRTI
ncbi:hypothetical protein [Arthrobacter sp. Alg241-R88]|uniref:hypothetical protein n=1 Tax=Arthrobacter sp. Alg241-R88 TaxID=2305984 RepID=UPI0013CFA34B|nr:hypothetical protein [Arthrobacter sp. Alg241-R88]